MAPSTVGAPHGAASSGKGRFADQWHTHTGARAQEEARQQELRQRVAKARYGVAKAIESGQIEDALAAAEVLLESGETPSQELLYRMLCTTAALPGIERFAKAVNCCTKSGLEMDPLDWAALVGRLMARDAPHAQVRVCLNFGVPKDGEPLELVPVEANRQSDVEKVFAGPEHLDLGELSDEQDIEAAARAKGGSAKEWSEVPKAMEFSIGGVASSLRGTYKRCKYTSGDGQRSNRPVFKKEGTFRDQVIVAYFYTPPKKSHNAYLDGAGAGDEEWRPGWYVGSEVGGGGITYAYCAIGERQARSMVPPAHETWVVLDGHGGKLEERGGFQKAPDKPKGSNAQVVDWEEAAQLLQQIDLAAIPGRVRTRGDPEAVKYFCHFFILVHLEQLAEVAGFRGRFGFRTAQELSQFGIALINSPVVEIGPYRSESRKVALPGWPEQGNSRVTFELPKGKSLEYRDRFGLTPGSQVIISRGHPLETRVAEGTVSWIWWEGRQLVVNVNGKWPDFPKKAKFRLDTYANRVTFERQVSALLQFVTMQRTKMQDMLVAAGVGKVDMAVLGGDGFMDPEQGASLTASSKEAVQPETEPEKLKQRASSVMSAKQVRAMLEERSSDGAAAAAATAGASDEAPAHGEPLDHQDGEDNKSEGGEEPLADVEDKMEEQVEEFEEIALEDDSPNADSADERPDEGAKEARRLARELAQQYEQGMEVDEEAGSEPAPKNPAEKEAASAGASSTGARAQESTRKIPGEEKQKSEETEEERIKRATLALAREDAEGIDRNRLREVLEMVQTLPDLSVSQRRAICNSMSKRLTIVQGPPGTGKTHTAVRILTLWAKQMLYKPLLATSECNVAVDNIAVGLAKTDVKVVRMGRTEKAHEALQAVCLTNMLEEAQHAREEEAQRLGNDSDLEELGEEPQEEGEKYDQWRELFLRHKRRRKMNEKNQQFDRDRFINDAEVLCATTAACGSQAMSGLKFHGILIDEVAQATETSALVPIIMRGAKQIVLCGDHCQLPPSTVSREAELRGMSLSLYSRLVEAGVPFEFLDTQYRAHPALMAFSASCIYQNRLKNGITAASRPVPKGVPWPSPSCPAAFFECSDPEGLNGESKNNEGEARDVVKLVSEVLRAGEIGFGGIGVVTPYKGQVRTLRSVMHEFFKESDDFDVMKKELEIASVDNFQGREKELIIFSAVRSNNIAQVGFLKDWRRLNVMITRARRGLVVIGNAATLVCDRHWRLWLQFTEKQGGCAQGTVKAAVEEAQDNLLVQFSEREAEKRIERMFKGFTDSRRFVKDAVERMKKVDKTLRTKAKKDAPEQEAGTKKRRKDRWWSTEGSRALGATKRKKEQNQEDWWDEWDGNQDDEWWDENAQEELPDGQTSKKKARRSTADAAEEDWGDGWGEAEARSKGRKGGGASRKAAAKSAESPPEGDLPDESNLFPEDWEDE